MIQFFPKPMIHIGRDINVKGDLSSYEGNADLRMK